MRTGIPQSADEDVQVNIDRAPDVDVGVVLLAAAELAGTAGATYTDVKTELVAEFGPALFDECKAEVVRMLQVGEPGGGGPDQAHGAPS